jgi:hypothetical protein
MQRIEECASSAEEYVKSEGHRQVRPERSCPRCGRRQRLHRHGSYGRSVTSAVGKVLRILVARFLCRGCRRTVSYLPGFALSYRVVGAATVEAFLTGSAAGGMCRRGNYYCGAMSGRWRRTRPRWCERWAAGLGGHRRWWKACGLGGKRRVAAWRLPHANWRRSSELLYSGVTSVTNQHRTEIVVLGPEGPRETMALGPFPHNVFIAGVRPEVRDHLPHESYPVR